MGKPVIDNLDFLGIRDILCLGHDIEFKGIEIVHDGHALSREFAKIISGHLRSEHQVAVSVVDRPFDINDAAIPFRQIASEASAVRTMTVPALRIYLNDDGESVAMKNFDNFAQLYGSAVTLDWKHWLHYKQYAEDEKAREEECKKSEAMQNLCGLMSLFQEDDHEFVAYHNGAVDARDAMVGAIEYLNGDYREHSFTHGQPDVSFCTALEDVKARRGIIYGFGPLPEGRRERRELRKEWERLFKGVKYIGFASVPSDEFWDNYAKQFYEVVIDLETVEKNGYAPIVIDGDLLRVSLRNELQQSRVPVAYPPLAIDTGGDRDTAFILDLRALGKGVFRRVISPRVNTFVDDFEPVGSYGLIVHPKYPFLHQTMSRELSEISQILAETEEMWGFAGQDLTELIYAVPCLKKNAHVRQTNPRTMIVCNGTLQNIFKDPFFVRHEMAHELHVNYPILEKGGTVSLFKWLKGLADGHKFFTYITEFNFIPGSNGGHPWDDPDEFFASMLNSLNRPLWYVNLYDSDARMVRLYTVALATLYSDLQKTFGQDQALVVELGRKIKFIHDFVLYLEIKQNDPPWTENELISFIGAIKD